jgi:hypothetical protein
MSEPFPSESHAEAYISGLLGNYQHGDEHAFVWPRDASDIRECDPEAYAECASEFGPVSTSYRVVIMRGCEWYGSCETLPTESQARASVNEFNFDRLDRLSAFVWPSDAGLIEPEYGLAAYTRCLAMYGAP